MVFDWIRKRQVTDEPFVHELGEVLELSTDSVYRRLRGETALNLYEIERITEVYDFSLDEVMGTSATRLAFNYKPIREESFHFIDYLKYIDNMMSTIAATTNPRMYYMANDIPFFQLMNSPLIASFKLFFWQKTILDFKSYKHLKFKLFEKTTRSMSWAGPFAHHTFRYRPLKFTRHKPLALHSGKLNTTYTRGILKT